MRILVNVKNVKILSGLLGRKICRFSYIFSYVPDQPGSCH